MVVRDGACAAALALLLAGCTGGLRAEARAPDERVAVLVATAEVKGVTEPCGCTSDPLGDVARVAALARGGLLLDAGGLLYDRELLSPGLRAQADAKAAFLADLYRRGAVGLGAGDLVAGPERVQPARQAANVSGIALAPPRVFDVKGVKIGVFGVVAPERVPDLSAGPPEEAARRAVAALKAQGAEVVVALCGMSRAETRRLMQAVDGIGFGIVGAEVGEGMPEAEPVGDGFLVAPADEGRRAVQIALHVKKEGLRLVPFAGEAQRTARLAKVEARIVTLGQQLAAWKKDPEADAAFVAAREEELGALERERTRLRTEQPTPPASSYFTYALVPIKRALRRDAQVAKKLAALDRAIGRANLEAARVEAPPAAEPGQPSYVGMAECVSCHKAAGAFWKKTVHARAWRSLVAANKQYDYECIGCHVTGFGKPGGAHLASVEKKGLVDVQCEVCHGPGSTHVEESGVEEPKTMTLAPPEDFCARTCHTKEHSDTFQLEPYLRDVLGKGHGEKRRLALGEGVTGRELRARAITDAKK